MPVDPRIDQLKSDLDAISEADVAEDAAYETQIATLTAERDALQTTINGAIANLIVARDAIDASITSLEARITALGG